MTEKLGSPDQHLQEVVRLSCPDYQISLEKFTVAMAPEIFALIDSSRDHLDQHGETTAVKYQKVEDVIDSIINPKPRRYRFGIRNTDGVLVGSVNITFDENHPERAEVGYYLGRGFTKQGYATRAVRFLTEYAFNSLGCHLLYGSVREDNLKSQHVFERAGYKETGRETETADGETYKYIIYTKPRVNG